MVTTRRSSLKRVGQVANAAVNEGQQHLNQDKTCSLPSLRIRPSGYARREPSKKKKKISVLTWLIIPIYYNSKMLMCNSMTELITFRQKTVIPDPKGFDKFHSSGQLEPLNCDLPAASNSSMSISATAHKELDPLLDHKTIAGSGGTKNADKTTSQGGNNVASNNLNSVQGGISSNCFLGNGPQKSASFNLTEIAEKMGNDVLDEVNSFGSETKVSVGGYNVKPKYEVLVGHILSKYGDIGVNCSRTNIFRSYGVELVCEITQQLMDTNIVAITDDDVEQMMSYVKDLEKENLDIVWLKERLNVIREAKQAFQILRSAKEKNWLAELKAEFKKRGQQLEDDKRVLAVKEVEVQDLKKKIFADECDFVTMKDRVTKADKVVSENRAKLRYVVNLGTLGEGLI